MSPLFSPIPSASTRTDTKAMGADGGTIPTRDELVKVKKKAVKVGAWALLWPLVVVDTSAYKHSGCLSCAFVVRDRDK